MNHNNTAPRRTYGNGDGNRGPLMCYRCNEEDHMARNCTSNLMTGSNEVVYGNNRPVVSNGSGITSPYNHNNAINVSDSSINHSGKDRGHP